MLLALLCFEIGARLVYLRLPYPLQQQLSGARLYGLGGPHLGQLISDEGFFATCVGDPYYFAKHLPGIEDQPIRSGPGRRWTLSTTDLGFEGIGFRSRPLELRSGSVASISARLGVVVGDSFGSCFAVDYEDCWVDHLARDDGWQMANLSMTGTGSISHLRYLQDYGWALEPELVIWQFYANDFLDDHAHAEGLAQGCPRATEAPADPQAETAGEPRPELRTRLSHSLVSYNLVVPWIKARMGRSVPDAEARYRSIATVDGRRLMVHAPLVLEPAEHQDRERSLEALVTASAEARARGVGFLLLLVPRNLEVYEGLLDPSEFGPAIDSGQRLLDEMVDLAEVEGIEFLDLRPALSRAARSGADPYQVYDVHWTAEGNRLVSQQVAARLAELR